MIVQFPMSCYPNNSSRCRLSSLSRFHHGRSLRVLAILWTYAIVSVVLQVDGEARFFARWLNFLDVVIIKHHTLSVWRQVLLHPNLVLLDQVGTPFKSGESCLECSSQYGQKYGSIETTRVLMLNTLEHRCGRERGERSLLQWNLFRSPLDDSKGSQCVRAKNQCIGQTLCERC
jgi:hypothetical protein